MACLNHGYLQLISVASKCLMGYKPGKILPELPIHSACTVYHNRIPMLTWWYRQQQLPTIGRRGTQGLLDAHRRTTITTYSVHIFLSLFLRTWIPIRATLLLITDPVSVISYCLLVIDAKCLKLYGTRKITSDYHQSIDTPWYTKYSWRRYFYLLRLL